MKTKLTINQVQMIYHSLEESSSPNSLRSHILSLPNDRVWESKSPLTVWITPISKKWLEQEVKGQIKYFQDTINECRAEGEELSDYWKSESAYYPYVVKSLKNILKKIN